MRTVDNMIQVELKNSYNVMNIGQLPDFDIQDYDLFDDKQMRKYINDLKRMVRNSIEYSLFRDYLVQYMEMNQDMFYQNVSNEDGERKVKLHIHHEPFTLEDICQIVFNKRVAYNEPLEIELVAKEVMFLHWGYVALVCVSETTHQLIHNNYLFVPLDKVYGNYKKFTDLYRPFIPPEMLDTLERNEQATLNMRLNTEILERSDTYLEFGGDCKLPTMDIIRSMINKENGKHSSNVGNTNSQFIIPAIIVDKKEE